MNPYGFHLGADLCEVAPEHDRAVRCQLRVGHGGRHEYRNRRPGAVITARWPDPPDAVGHAADTAVSRTFGR